jgi:hypothetical protein
METRDRTSTMRAASLPTNARMAIFQEQLAEPKYPSRVDEFRCSTFIRFGTW